MINRLLHIFLHTLAALCLCSCTLEEPIDTPQNSEGYIEFVARPTSYDKHDVATKTGTPDPIEDAIYNLHFLLFENATDSGRLVKHESLDPSNLNASMKTDKGLTNAYACFLANVSDDFLSEITTVGALKSAIYNIEEYTISDDERLGVPVIQVNGVKTPCLPMFGATSSPINMSGNRATTAVIALERLFAKVVVNLNLAIPEDNATTFSLTKLSLTNLPTKVALTTPASESTWAGKTSTDFVNPVSIDLSGESVTSGGASAYQAICYVPEYKVNPELTASQVDGYNAEQPVQIYKPSLCPNKRPAYVTIEGSMGGNIYYYYIYLGEDNHSNFNLLRNTQYTNNITITGTTSADVDHRVTYTTMPTMLVNGEAANCYMINAPGKYQLDTYKGVCKNLSKDKLLKGYPCIVANDGNVSLSLWNSGVYDDKIILDVGNTGVLGQYLEILTTGGNAVVGLNSKADGTGEWLWTWHLWFSVELKVGSTTLLSSDTQDYPSGAELMDRNLGSSPSTEQILMPGIAQGLYYRHGHRSPYFSTVNYPNATNYPGYKDSDVKTWTHVKESSYTVVNSSGVLETKTNHKSEMDPCPAGYRVPSSSVWYSEKNSDMNFGSSYFTYLPLSLLGGVNFDPIYYPYTGYIDESGEWKTRVIEDDSNKRQNLTIPVEYTRTLTWSKVSTPMQFIALSYTEATEAKEGSIWCDGPTCLRYGYNEFNRTFSGFIYYKGTWSGGIWASVKWDKTTEFIMSESELKSYERGTVHSLVMAQVSLANAWNDYFSRSESTTYDSNSQISDTEAEYGYQLRCVVDN